MSAGENKVLKTLNRYVAKDKDGDVNMYDTKPFRYKCENIEYWVDGHTSYKLAQSFVNIMFPDLKWEDDPIEIEISIRRKE